VHEFGYCEAVLQAVERRAAGRQVARLGVRVGTLHRIVPGAFQQSFEFLAAGGIADGATTEVAVVPVEASCRACGRAFTSSDSVPACPGCGSLDLQVSGGDELILEWLEYREPSQGAGEHPADVVFDHSHPAGEDAHVRSSATGAPSIEGS